jgi:hypothetical protein
MMKTLWKYSLHLFTLQILKRFTKCYVDKDKVIMLIMISKIWF